MLCRNETFLFVKKFVNDDLSITLPSNYSGTCEHTPLNNEDLLRIPGGEEPSIHRLSLFSLKYRVIPRTARQYAGSTSADDIEDDDDALLSFSPQQRSLNGKRHQTASYHAKR
ncbi:hypothetical protein I4U23_015773 [Adineta vaga]|nr:hypothetical protein I4U23_015773 [Adineta vaga]